MELYEDMGTKVSGLFLEDSLKVISLFSRPSILSSHSNLSLRTDEYILRLDISDFLTFRVERSRRLDDRVHQVP